MADKCDPLQGKTQNGSVILELRELRDFDQLVEIEEPWRDLARRSHALPYLGPAFMLPWLQLARDMYEPRVLTAWEGEKLIGLAPLFDRKIGPPGLKIVRRSFPIYGDSPPFDLLLDGEASAIVEAFAERWGADPSWDLIELLNVPLGSPTREFLGGAVRSERLKRRPGNSTYYVPTIGSWTEYHGALSRQFRRALRKNRNRCEREGDIRYRRFPGDMEEAEALALAQGVISRSWKRFDDGGAWTGFLGRLVESLHAAGQLSLLFLYIGDRPLAYLLEIEQSQTIYAFHIATDLAHPRLGLGHLILGEALRRAYEGPYKRYDFAGSTGYLGRWAQDQSHFESLYLLRKRLRSNAGARAYLALKAWADARSKRQTESLKRSRRAGA